jgi:hypothetical protein
MASRLERMSSLSSPPMTLRPFFYIFGVVMTTRHMMQWRVAYHIVADWQDTCCPLNFRRGSGELRCFPQKLTYCPKMVSEEALKRERIRMKF